MELYTTKNTVLLVEIHRDKLDAGGKVWSLHISKGYPWSDLSVTFKTNNYGKGTVVPVHN
jgi:hypothetical protein